MKLSRLVAPALGVLLLSAQEVSAVLLWGTSSSTDGLSLIDSETGEHSFLGRFSPDTTKFTVPLELSTRPSDGAIFIVNNTVTAQLAIVDPATALATTLYSGSFGAIAFDRNDVLYAHMIGPSTTATGPMATMNLQTGAFTSLGGPALPRLTGLAFNPLDNLLYGATLYNLSTGEQNLLKIDPLTGQILASVSVSGAGGSGIDDLVFDSGGNAIVSASAGIGALNITTGVVSNRLRYSPTIAGFQGIGLVIPEVSSAMLIVAGSSLLALRRRRRS